MICKFDIWDVTSDGYQKQCIIAILGPSYILHLSFSCIIIYVAYSNMTSVHIKGNILMAL